ncbi:hypothetical protein BDF22DRAFT_265209 [Syncephalis plumigaleata]|nr:hypothetical protein BDF22DRAFT_265209 [Syncephalis plumigaleata]
MELAFAKSFVYLHHKSDAPLDVIRPSDDKQSLTVLVDTSDNRDTSFNVDYCVDIHEEQDHSRVTSHFKHATSQVLQGIHASVFSMSAGNRVATEILDQLERSWSKQRDQYKVSYVFIGITDARCLDISNGATIDGETLQKQGLDRFYEKVNDCSSIKELVIRGCSRPSLMSIRVEKSGAHPTCAFLSLVDFGPADFTPNPLVELQSPTSVNVLSKSFEVFMQVVRYSAQSTFNGYLPTDNSMLTRLTAGAIGQNCATTFILHVEANKKDELSEIVQALKFAETARKIRCHLAPVKVDLRLPYYENKYRHQCDIIEEKEAHVRGLENEWETRLNEANNKLQEEQAEKERVLNRCQQLENELSATANDLRQQYEETNAKMHHEMELLKKQETLQLTRTEKNSVEAQVLYTRPMFK